MTLLGEQSGHKFKEGQRVLYEPLGERIQTRIGLIREIINEPEEALAHHASLHTGKHQPRYLIEDVDTTHTAAYKEGQIIQIIQHPHVTAIPSKKYWKV